MASLDLKEAFKRTLLKTNTHQQTQDQLEPLLESEAQNNEQNNAEQPNDAQTQRNDGQTSDMPYEIQRINDDIQTLTRSIDEMICDIDNGMIDDIANISDVTVMQYNLRNKILIALQMISVDAGLSQDYLHEHLDIIKGTIINSVSVLGEENRRMIVERLQLLLSESILNEAIEEEQQETMSPCGRYRLGRKLSCYDLSHMEGAKVYVNLGTESFRDYDGIYDVREDSLMKENSCITLKVSRADSNDYTAYEILD